MHEDTIALLGDCTAGIEMAVSTMDGLLPEVQNQVLRRRLRDSIDAHQQLRAQTCALLRQCGGQEKSPGSMAKSMSWLKTNTRMALHRDDTTAAYLVADGCDSGIRSLCRSRNLHVNAGADARSLAEKLIDCEEKLSASMRPFL